MYFSFNDKSSLFSIKHIIHDKINCEIREKEVHYHSER